MADRREAIVGAALEVIAESGLGSFTQPRVARRVGLRQSHLTYYFPTRDDLLFAVAEEAVRRRVSALAAVDEVSGRAEKVAALARVLASPEQTRVLLALTQAADQHEEVRASFAALARDIAPLGAALLGTCGIRADEEALALLQATSTGIAVLTLARGGDDDGALARRLLEEFLTALAGSRPAPEHALADG